jgi:hypothetical protein
MTSNPEPGTLNPEPDRDQDSPMTSTYVGVLALEAVIIAALWIFGRMFS